MAAPVVMRRPLVGFAIVFVSGIWCGLNLDLPCAAVYTAALCVLAVAALFFFAVARYPALTPAVSPLILAAAGLGAWALACPTDAGRNLQRLIGQEERPLELRGTVAGDPDSGPRLPGGAFAWTFPFRVEGGRASADEAWRPMSGVTRVLWYAPSQRLTPAYGERWILARKTRNAPPQGAPFRRQAFRVEAGSSARAAPLEGTEAFCQYAGAVSGDRKNPGEGILFCVPCALWRPFCNSLAGLASHCYEARRASLNYLSAGIRDFPVEAGIYQSLLLGYRWGLNREAQDLFAATGTIHIFAVSGSHVVLIAGMIIFALRAFRVSRRYWVAGVGPLLVAYTVFVGGASSAVRACLMAILFLLAPLLHRRADASTALAMAAVLILGFAPDQLADVGFICSFVVVAGLILLCPILDRPIRAWFRPDPFRLEPELRRTVAARAAGKAIASTAAVSLAAWLAAAPLTAHYFGRFSLVTLPSNLFVIPLSFLVILCGCLSLLLGPCLAVAGQVFNHAALALIWLLVKGAKAMVAIPGGNLQIPPLPVGWLWLWYALLACAALWWKANRLDTGHEG